MAVSGYSGRQRICDTCFELHSSAQGAQLNDDLNVSKQIEATLKAGLKEKKEQVAWCEEFLRSVGSHDPAAAASSFSEEESADMDGNVQRMQLIKVASLSWLTTESTVAEKRVVLQQLTKECAKFQEELDSSAARAHGLKARNDALEKELAQSGNRSELEAAQELAARELSESQRELAGLVQRRMALEDQQRSTSSFSFLSFDSRAAFNERVSGCRRGACARSACNVM